MPFDLTQEDLLTVGLWFIPVILVLLAIKQLWPVLRHQREEGRIKKLLESVSSELLRDINIPDGMDGMVHVDYLLMTPSGLIVVDLEHREGVLFGSEHIDVWTQAIGMKTWKFTNPLHGNKLKVSAVKGVVPSINVRGRVIFSEGDFLKGKPQGISMLDEVVDDLQDKSENGALSAHVIDAWNHIKQLAMEERSSRRHEAMHMPSRFRGNVIKAILLLVVAAAVSMLFLNLN